MTSVLKNLLNRKRPCIWLLSAYRSDSHAAWANWLKSRVTGVDWQIRELPGRHFAWRIRGNPLSWLDDLPAAPPDLIVASSMVDLATIKGLHPRLAGRPCWYYFHENQFAYPLSDRQLSTIEAAMVQVYGALAADQLLFNSEWNRQSFLQGVADLLARMPDQVPGGVVERLVRRSRVLPVPVETIEPAQQRDPGLILWNHRWEHDKAPELFTEAMLKLAVSAKAFRLALLGHRGPRSHPALDRLREKLPDHIVADGFLERSEYQRLVGRASIVVSTARHEFQGLSLLEAVSAGARPLVPDALCYREQYACDYRYPAGDITAMVHRLADWLSGGLPPPADVSAWLADRTGPKWQESLGAVLPENQSGGSSIS